MPWACSGNLTAKQTNQFQQTRLTSSLTDQHFRLFMVLYGNIKLSLKIFFLEIAKWLNLVIGYLKLFYKYKEVQYVKNNEHGDVYHRLPTWWCFKLSCESGRVCKGKSCLSVHILMYNWNHLKFLREAEITLHTGVFTVMFALLEFAIFSQLF